MKARYMTWRELRDQLNSLSDELLDMEVHIDHQLDGFHWACELSPYDGEGEPGPDNPLSLTISQETF